MTTVTITVGYTIGDSKKEMKKADELYREFNERFLKEFPKAKLAGTYICRKKFKNISYNNG